MFKRLRKQWKCGHEYHRLGTFRKWTGSEYVEYVKVYCPKCGHETYGTENQWRHEQAKKRIREDYERRNGK